MQNLPLTAENWITYAHEYLRERDEWRATAKRFERLLEGYEKEPTKETLTKALEDALYIIERCVDPAMFRVNTGPDADGDDANAAALIGLLRSLNVTLEAAQGKDGPATKVAKALGELT
jgi:hypothetical protein